MVLVMLVVVTALTAAPGGVTGAVPSAAQIFVTDSEREGTSRIVRINDTTGAGWTTFGTYGRGTKQFSDLAGVPVR